MKKCNCCGIEKPLDDYYEVRRKTPLVRKIKTDNRVPRCKACYKEKAKQWVKDNPEARKAIARRWDSANVEKRAKSAAAHNAKDSTKEGQRLWRKANGVAYHRGRRQNDPMFAFKWKMRTILLKAFYRGGYKKRSKSNAIFGCSWVDLIAHLEKQFSPGMTWENRGEWEIDHIVPLATAACEDDIIRLNHYSNLQPLWAHDNRTKSAKLGAL